MLTSKLSTKFKFQPRQETAKDGVAGLQSGNKIWEDWPENKLKLNG